MSPLVTVLVGTSLLGCVAGVVGCFAVLRRRALAGDLMAHAALPGLCLAFLIIGQRQFGALVLGAFATGLLGMALVTFVCRWTRTKEDAAIGIVLSTFFGAGIVLSSIIQRQTTLAGKAGLETYIYGQAAAMGRQDVIVISIVSLAVLTIVLLFYKEFKSLSFDPEFARTQGWPTLALDLLMMGTVALVTVAALPAVGVILTAAMLITPAATARLWTNRLDQMILLAAAIGAMAAATGTFLSSGMPTEWLGFDPLAFGRNTGNLPTGPLIVLSGTAYFLASLFFAPGRGLLARAWAEAQLRSKTSRENLLRTLYELSESQLPARSIVKESDVLAQRAWGPLRAGMLVRWAMRQALIERVDGGLRLTQLGLARAGDLTRRHRLWELYLIQGANIAPDHVDRDADSIEHMLPAEILRQLESELRSAGQLPPGPTVPESPHEVLAATEQGGGHG